MKKLIKFFSFIVLVLLIGISGFFYARQKKNIVSIVPYPYYSQKVQIPKEAAKAPILIIGDRMGKRLDLFKDNLIKKLSENLSKPIQINTLAKDGLSLARVIQEIKNYGRLPFIIIYAGMSQEFNEKRFNLKDIPNIDKNFKLYDDLWIQTLLNIKPEISKFIYHPVNYVVLKESIEKDKQLYDIENTLKRRIYTFKLFEREMRELFTYVKENNSILIALTNPINIEMGPKKICSTKLDEFSEKNYQKVLSLIKQRDYKQAYSISKDLTLIAPSNALVHYAQGKISKFLGKYAEARASFNLAASLDCDSSKPSPIFNTILKKIAKEQSIIVFDFDKLVYSSWEDNVLFESEIYPQNLYYQKLVNMLSIKIKRILKL